MPTYDYRCMECQHQFEEFQNIADKPLETCPVCGGQVQRLISGGTGLIFKGSGFYITDYKDNKAGKSENGAKANGKTGADKGTTQDKSSEPSAKSGKKSSSNKISD